MKAINENAKDFGYLVAAGAAIIAIYSGVHSFVYPRTEANASLDAIAKRVDTVEKKQGEENQVLKEDIREIKRDVNGIYQILIGRTSGSSR